MGMCFLILISSFYDFGEKKWFCQDNLLKVPYFIYCFVSVEQIKNNNFGSLSGLPQFKVLLVCLFPT